jgi:flagellar motor switch/type III secretory pathway protein FliN
MSDFLGWKPGTIVSFDQSATAPLTIRVDDKVVGIGQAVKVGQKFGLRITRAG